ncbi:MAG: hypothetical protein JO129_03160 [Candidatus Dependentiae bacterium]|nr:hypothetical protein [Candidatus Dependentiae bacterium]
MKNKLLAVLLIFSQMIIASSEKTTKESLKKTITVFQKFETPYPNCASERISLFSQEDLSKKHRSRHHGGDYLFSPGTVMNSESVDHAKLTDDQKKLRKTTSYEWIDSWYHPKLIVRK